MRFFTPPRLRRIVTGRSLARALSMQTRGAFLGREARGGDRQAAATEHSNEEQA